MGFLGNISDYKAKLRKEKDKKLALRAKTAKAEIRRQNFISKSNATIAKAKQKKQENSFLYKAVQKGKEISAKAEQNRNKRGSPKFSTASKLFGDDGDRVRDAVSIGGKKRKPYDPFNL
jgi:hypothetical protein